MANQHQPGSERAATGHLEPVQATTDGAGKNGVGNGPEQFRWRLVLVTGAERQGEDRPATWTRND